MVRRIKPVSRSVKFQTEVDRIRRDRAVRKDTVPRLDELWLPAVDIRENHEALVFTAELPGMSKDDVRQMLGEPLRIGEPELPALEGRARRVEEALEVLVGAGVVDGRGKPLPERPVGL